MKHALPLEATRQFFTDLRNQAGRIQSKEFVEFQQETYASYKTKFEKNILSVNISIAIIQGGKICYYGVIKTNDSIKPIDNQSKIFEIGSITKVFTSTVLASLVEKKKIRLTDEINGYYSFPFKNNVIISFESLANHTSGLPRLPENLDLHNDVNPYKDYGKKLLNIS